MPEFLFRRKKQQSRRRSTLNDVQETRQDIQGARDQLKPSKDKVASSSGGASGGASMASAVGKGKELLDGKDTIRREKEQFMELYKNKYPEDAARLGLTNGTADLNVGGASNGGGGGGRGEGGGDVVRMNGDGAMNHVSGSSEHLAAMMDDPDGLLLPSSSDEMSHDQSHDSSDSFIIKTTSTAELPAIITTPRKISKYDECLFLRYRKAIRRCPMPSPITLSTLKNLFVNMFDLSPTLLDNSGCSLYIQDKTSPQQWEPLTSMSMVTDHCTIQLKDRSSKRLHKRVASSGDAPDVNTSLDVTTNLRSIPQQKQTTLLGSERSLTTKAADKKSATLGGASSGALVKAASHNDVLKAEKSTPTTADLAAKLNSLWYSGRSVEVDDLTLLSDSHPLHQQQPGGATSSGSDVIMTSPFSTSSTSGVSSDPQVDQKKLSSMARSLKASIKSLKTDLAELRQDHVHQASAFSLSMLQTKQKIISGLTAAVSVARLGPSSVAMESFRRDRLKLYSMKQDYDKKSKPTLHELELLECAVEGMRIDVVDRRCRVSEREVSELHNQVGSIEKTVKQLEALYTPLEDLMKHVMEKELQIIVKEERFVEEEGPRLDEALDKCHTLQTTLHNLNQYAVVQTHRTPLIPYFAAEADPDRHALMENIQAIHPNHKHRAKEVKKAEKVMLRRKEFTSSTKAALKEFENELSTKRRNLRHVRRFSDIELHRLMKAKEYFLKEKDVRKKQLEEELHIQGKLAVQKREQEKRRLMENMRWQGLDFDDLPPAAPVRKSRSHLSVNSVHDSVDGYSDRDLGHGVPFHSTRSDDQVLPHSSAYKSGRGAPGLTPIHHQQLQGDDHKRHSIHLGDGFSHHSTDSKHSNGSGHSAQLASSSTYDSLAKMRESFVPSESSKSSGKSKSSTIGYGHQLKIYHSPISQSNTMASTSTTSTQSGGSSSSVPGARSKRISSGSGGGGNQSVNLQALTMLPKGSIGSSGGGAGSGTSYNSSKLKQPSPLATKRMDARGGTVRQGTTTGKALSDFTPTSSKSHKNQLSPSSQSVAKVQQWRKSQHHMNGLPSRYHHFGEYNSQPDTSYNFHSQPDTSYNFFGYNDSLMEHSSLSQPVEADMPPSSRHYQRKYSPDLVPVRSEGRDQSQATSKSFYRSASDESVYDTMRTSSRASRASRASTRAKDFNVKESKSWAKTFALSVFNTFSSSSDKDKDKDKSKSSKHKHRQKKEQQQDEHSKGGQSKTLGSNGGQGSAPSSSGNQSRFHHTYSHHTPKSLKVKSSKKHGDNSLPSPDDQVEQKSVRFTSNHRQQNPPHSTGGTPHGYIGDDKMPHPNSAPSLTTMTTRSTGNNRSNLFSGESPLTSYPRSHTQAMQHMRGGHPTTNTASSSSNYKVTVARINNGDGVGGRSYREQRYSQNGHFKNSLSNSNLTDVAQLGSLV